MPEEMGSSKHKCPCGKETYTVTSYMDDWGRSEERWNMDCSTCRQNYRLFSYDKFDSGMQYNGYLWVPRDLYANLENIDAQLLKAKKEIVEYAKVNYMNKWLSYFKDAKSKKEIWRRLHNLRPPYPSLTTFYARLKFRGLEEHLRDAFVYENIFAIMQMLGISDNELEDELQASKEIGENLRQAQTRLREEGFY